MIEAHVRLYLAYHTRTLEGESYIRFQELKVDSSELVFLAQIPFVVTHPIDDDVKHIYLCKY
jgi:hypothetical protein